MACNYKKHHKVLAGGFTRAQEGVRCVNQHNSKIFLCPSCGAIRIDFFDAFCYRRGRWSKPNPTQKNTEKG